MGGTTAIFVDFAHVLGQKLPLFIGLVVGLSFILLALVFRSIVIPATAAVMNLLSIGAAFGIVVAVFQHGTLASLFGVSRPGPIEAFLPVMMFAILFGLSMDYEVFLISRIHEEWLKSGDNRTAVRNGLAATGKTITAAALIMILVFGSFILGGEPVIKKFGLGLAAGILVDAVVHPNGHRAVGDVSARPVELVVPPLARPGPPPPVGRPQSSPPARIQSSPRLRPTGLPRSGSNPETVRGSRCGRRGRGTDRRSARIGRARELPRWDLDVPWPLARPSLPDRRRPLGGVFRR